jgi:hypothetical protein
MAKHTSSYRKIKYLYMKDSAVFKIWHKSELTGSPHLLKAVAAIIVAHLRRIAAFCSPTAFLMLFLDDSERQCRPIWGSMKAALFDERADLSVKELAWRPSMLRKD